MCLVHISVTEHETQETNKTIRLAAQLNRCYATVTLGLFSVMNPLDLHSHMQVLLKNLLYVRTCSLNLRALING